MIIEDQKKVRREEMPDSEISVSVVPHTSNKLYEVRTKYKPGFFAKLFGAVETQTVHIVPAFLWNGFTYEMRAGKTLNYKFGALPKEEKQEATK